MNLNVTGFHEDRQVVQSQAGVEALQSTNADMVPEVCLSILPWREKKPEYHGGVTGPRPESAMQRRAASQSGK